ncbi:DUF3667 domain-containing protein [Echinicola salinicaeni]|uniref:DUF3667 domain-containing protein n=1 Tax=Echinicola salinicaeni TaxID=2762757 RepID=UPI0016471911|nr:DUF3667 domain-containing protein [Echinicola salinicaeni]
MKKNRKLTHCLNCNQKLSNEDNYCPHCGQENMDKNVSIGLFIKDFFSNYISFETKLFRTIPIFISQPGRLSIEFNEGKRTKYIHPIRMYLILSLFYFFIISSLVPKNLMDKAINLNSSPPDSTTSTAINITDSIKQKEIQKLNKTFGDVDTDSLTKELNLPDSLASSPLPSKSAWQELKVAAQDEDISDSAFMDMLHNKYNFMTDLDNTIIRNFIANSNLFFIESAKNLPLMMFVLLPFFALYMKLLYIRSPNFYVEHLVQGLHLHSFAYLIYGLGLLLIKFTSGIGEGTFWFCFIAVSTYTYISLLKTQKQGWFRTLLKFWLLGLFYFITLFIAILAELYLSLLLV